jgi:hypothetical protein
MDQADKASTHLDESNNDNTLAELLKQSRKELADQAKDWEARIRKHESSLRLGTASFALLPELRFPLKIPVWQEAQFSDSLGLSIPSNLANAQDLVADRLARFGDLEAARKLAGANAKLPQSSPTERNYPLEWTRLVALMQLDAEYRLAIGDTEGAKELISLHRQLLKVLDDKAKQGPLGSALLGNGRTALSAAVPSLKKDKDPELAQLIDSALASWGDVPSPLSFVSWDLPAEQTKKQGSESGPCRAVIFAKPLPTLDVLGLPAISEGCQAVVVFLDESGKTVEALVTYRPKMAEIVSHAGQLIPTLSDASYKQPGDLDSNRLRRTFQSENLKCEATLFPQGSVFGGTVRLVPSDAPSSNDSSASGQATIARDLGIIHLDRSFEQNRLLIAPQQQGDAVQTKRGEVLKKVTNALDNLAPSQVFIHREKGQDKVSKIIVQYERDKTAAPLHQIVSSLWRRLGPSQIAESQDKEFGSLTLTWQDSRTRLTLDLPNSENLPVELVVENRPDKEGISLAKDASLDIEERKARIKAEKPLVRLPREMEDVGLGQSKEQVLTAHSESANTLKKDFPGGFLLVFPGVPLKEARSVLRQILVRLDGQGKAAEVSCRYERGPGANPGSWDSDLLKRWKKLGGAPAVSVSPAAAVWSDLDSQAPSPKTYTWRDDLTRMSLTIDGATADVTLLNCPLDEPKGVALGDLSFLSSGPEGCVLDSSRDALLKQWQVTKPVKTPKVDLVLYPTGKSPYDVLLVWFDGDKAARVVARFRNPAAKEKVGAGQTITDAWGRSMKACGWPSHHDFGSNQELTSMGTHDDKTRFRIYSQLSDDRTSRAFAEWK